MRPSSVSQRLPTPFSAILRRAVSEIPGAIGGAFAAADGETVDAVARRDIDDWLVLTAHYGVVLALVQTALDTLHYGGAEYMVLRHETVDILVHAVADGYFTLVAVSAPAPLGRALDKLATVADEPRTEMQ